MKFVGGEWHGTDLPAEAILLRRVGEFEITQLVNMTTGRSSTYVLSWWWQGPGLPLLPYFLATMMMSDDAVPLMREVLRAD